MLSSHIYKFTLAPDRNRENRHQLNLWTATCAVFLLCVATAIVAPAQTFTLLATFDGANGDQPSSLVQGTDGNFYGTTTFGGAPCVNWDGCGTVFRLNPAGEITTLHSFDLVEGIYPVPGLALATDGNFYGMTGSRVFRITAAGTLTTRYMFCSLPNCSDGSAPNTVVQGTDGNFYGTTTGGGAYGYGTVYKIAPAGVLTTLSSFCSQANCADGSGPSSLVQATDGNFYGTLAGGGTGPSTPCFSYGYSGCGTVFKITPTGKLTTLYSFCAEPNCADGTWPAGLVQATDGNFYGTTGATVINAGTVFKITPAGRLTTLYTFCAAIYGSCPAGWGPGGLIQATDRNLYGATNGGGAFGYGTLFKITPDGKLTILHSFDFTDGAHWPYCCGYTPPALVQAIDGKFYGTAVMGGGAPDCPGYPTYSCGTAFNLDVGLRPFVSFIRASGKVGATVQMLGQGFTGTTSVSFSGTPATFTIKSDTYLTATVPAGATTGFVTVTTPSGMLNSNKIFRVTPQILSISPPSGPVGTSVVITGESFTGADDVRLGGMEQMSFTVDSDTQITAIVPVGATSGGISVRTPGGQAKSATAFDVTP